jgi:hypothetical protein
MKLPTDPANPWSEGKIYTFGMTEIAVLKAAPYDPVRYYTEVYRYGQYIASYGSQAFTRLGAVLSAYWHDCPKQELGYNCSHALRSGGVVECGTDE